MKTGESLRSDQRQGKFLKVYMNEPHEKFIRSRQVGTGVKYISRVGPLTAPGGGCVHVCPGWSGDVLSGSVRGKQAEGGLQGSEAFTLTTNHPI